MYILEEIKLNTFFCARDNTGTGYYTIDMEGQYGEFRWIGFDLLDEKKT